MNYKYDYPPLGLVLDSYSKRSKTTYKDMFILTIGRNRIKVNVFYVYTFEDDYVRYLCNIKADDLFMLFNEDDNEVVELE